MILRKSICFLKKKAIQISSGCSFVPGWKSRTAGAPTPSLKSA